jgi:hypothetical protein
VAIDHTIKGKLPIRPQPMFILTQNIRELEMFKALQEYLGVGKLQKNKNNIVLIVKSLDEIVNTIIPLFDKTCLRGSKLLTYLIFKEVVLMMIEKKHLTLEGLIQIINFSYFMNKETSLRTIESKQNYFNILTDKFGQLPEIKNIPLPIINSLPKINLEFIRGEIDGDGSFNVSFRTKQRRIGVNFTIIHELSSISVLKELITFFKCGKVYSLKSAAARYQVQTVDEILNNIYPVFKNIEFNTNKNEHFNILIKVCKHIKTKGFKTDDDLKFIVDLAWEMNNKGKNRKLSKIEYLAKFNIKID